MIIVMKPGSSEENLSRVKEKIERAGLSYHLSVGESRTIVGVIGDKKVISSLEENMNALDGVEKAVRITEKYKLVSREFHPEPTVIDVRGFKIGGEELDVLTAWAVLAKRLKVQTKIVKELNAALDAKLKEKYPALTEEDIKELLVNRKWYYSIFEGIKALYVTTSHSMATSPRKSTMITMLSGDLM